MTIDEAIKSERIKAEYLKEQIHSPEPYVKASKCLEMAEEHEQIAKWLEELKHYRDVSNQLNELINSRPALKEIFEILRDWEQKS